VTNSSRIHPVRYIWHYCKNHYKTLSFWLLLNYFALNVILPTYVTAVTVTEIFVHFKFCVFIDHAKLVERIQKYWGLYSTVYEITNDIKLFWIHIISWKFVLVAFLSLNVVDFVVNMTNMKSQEFDPRSLFMPETRTSLIYLLINILHRCETLRPILLVVILYRRRQRKIFSSSDPKWKLCRESKSWCGPGPVAVAAWL